MQRVACALLCSLAAVGCQNRAATVDASAASEAEGVIAPAPSGEAAIVRALAAALEDERRSEAMYEAVIASFGDRKPFVNVVRAERRHQQMLLSEYERLGLTPPEAHAFEISVPDDFVSACAMAAEAERENIALYDSILAEVQEPGVHATFVRLRAMSENCHLPAFERHANGHQGEHGEAENASGCGGQGACGDACGESIEGNQRRGVCGGCCGGRMG